jgi:hypothetical protein
MEHGDSTRSLWVDASGERGDALPSPSSHTQCHFHIWVWPGPVCGVLGRPYAAAGGPGEAHYRQGGGVIVGGGGGTRPLASGRSSTVGAPVSGPPFPPLVL